MWKMILTWLDEPIGAYQIDHRTIKFLVGVIATTLGPITHAVAPTITSISASFYAYRNGAGPWASTIFIGFLFAIMALMLGYNGEHRYEGLLCRIAAGAAACVALFPCACPDECAHLPQEKWPKEVLPYMHGGAATVMFLVLACFCCLFCVRAWRKEHTRARVRAGIYALCAIAITAAMVVMALDRSLGRGPGDHLLFPDKLTLVGEITGLTAFGISWLLASHVFPVLILPIERHHLIGKHPDVRSPPHQQETLLN